MLWPFRNIGQYKTVTHLAAWAHNKDLALAGRDLGRSHSCPGLVTDYGNTETRGHTHGMMCIKHRLLRKLSIRELTVDVPVIARHVVTETIANEMIHINTQFRVQLVPG